MNPHARVLQFPNQRVAGRGFNNGFLRLVARLLLCGLIGAALLGLARVGTTLAFLL